MNKRLLVLIIFTAVIITTVIFFLSLLLNNRKIPVDNAPIATPINTTNAPSPTLLPNELTVVSILPSDDVNASYLPFQKVTIEFNDPIEPEGVFIETNPNIEIDILQGNDTRQIIIAPKTLWASGRNYITILQTTTSISGKRLLRPITYTINTSLPTLSPEELENPHP